MSRPEARKHYEFVEHTADLAIRAYGADLAEAFAAAGEAVFDIVTDGAEIHPDRAITVEVSSIDLEGLLVGFLSQLLLTLEVDGMVATDFTVTITGDSRLRAVGRGEPFEPERHGKGHQIKGVSYHMLELVESHGSGPSHVQVLFDV